MLPSNERLNRRQFQQILERSDISIIYNKIGTLKYVTDEKRALSVVISTKCQKKSVLRNLSRRRIYSLFKANGAKIRGIVYLSKISQNMSYQEIKRYFNELLEKTKKNSK